MKPSPTGSNAAPILQGSTYRSSAGIVAGRKPKRAIKTIAGADSPRHSWPRLRSHRLPLNSAGIVEQTARDGFALLDFDFRRIPRVRPLFAVCRVVGLRPVWIRT